MNSKCYLIQGSAGEYDDYHTWPVKVFLDKTAAECFLIDINIWIQNNSYQPKKTKGMWEAPRRRLNEDVEERNMPYDPNFHWSYTGADYSIEELELV